MKTFLRFHSTTLLFSVLTIVIIIIIDCDYEDDNTQQSTAVTFSPSIGVCWELRVSKCRGKKSKRFSILFLHRLQCDFAFTLSSVCIDSERERRHQLRRSFTFRQREKKSPQFSNIELLLLPALFHSVRWNTLIAKCKNSCGRPLKINYPINLSQWKCLHNKINNSNRVRHTTRLRAYVRSAPFALLITKYFVRPFHL